MTSDAGATGPLPDWVHTYMDAWNGHDVGAIAGHMTDDVVYIQVPLGDREEGKSAVRDYLGRLETAMSSDYRLELASMLIDGDQYAAEWTLTGTNDRADDQLGIPATGRRFEIPGVTLGKLRGGKIAEEKVYMDMAGYLRQIGLLPEQSAATADA
jgi:steroid delta-isomerase-like uncharacterized protein